MTTSLTQRKNALRARLDETFGDNNGYGYFDITLVRAKKHEPRIINIAWVVFPFEADVIAALGDLAGDDLRLERRQMWTCGIFHPDTRHAWETHEGNHYLEYDDDDEHSHCGYNIPERTLPESVEVELIADGETFESACRPGDYIKCPTCGGGATLLDLKNYTRSPCPDCARLGTDRNTLTPGILDLNVPEQRDFFQSRLDEARAKSAAVAAREKAKRDQAMQETTTLAKPVWKALPTRDAGILNGYPVATRVGCDYLNQAESPSLRSRCNTDATWFDPTTGLRVCTKHRKIKKYP